MEAVRTFDLRELPRSEAYALLNGAIVPRPIAWVGSVSIDGVTNLAPHSYSNVACVSPPMLLFVSVGRKDTVANCEATGVYTVNVVDRALAESMNVTAANAPHGVSEFGLAGVAAVIGTRVAAPRVAEAPVSFECEVERTIELGGEPSVLVLGRVVMAHVAERVLDARGRIDPAALDAVARLGGIAYSTIRDRFEMVRPTYADVMETQGATR